MYFHWWSLVHTHNIAGKVYEKDPQTLSEATQWVEKINTAQQVTITLSLPTVNMMSIDDRCCLCGRKDQYTFIILMHSATIVMVLVTSSRSAPRKFPHWKHLVTVIYHTSTIAATEDTGHTLSFTDPGKGTPLTGQDHTINLHGTEAPVTTGDMHPHSLSCHCSGSWFPSTDRYPRRHSSRDTPHHHRCNSSTPQHPYNQSHSHSYSTDCSWSSSRHSSDTSHRSHTRRMSKSKSWTATPIDPSIRRSLFRIHG